MSAPTKTQRWASVPVADLPLRARRVCSTERQASAVLKFVDRQRPFSEPVSRWVLERATVYRKQWPEVSAGKALAEACLDLIAWQRRRPDPVEVANFIADHEEANP